MWQLIPIAAISANGRGTYEYAQGHLVLHYGEGLDDTAAVTVRGDTLFRTFGNNQTETWARIAPARGSRSPLHGTWLGPCEREDCRMMTFLPGGAFFQESALVGHYAVDATTVTITPQGQPPMQFEVQIRGGDTILTQVAGAGRRLRHPRCDDPRLDPRNTFISACS